MLEILTNNETEVSGRVNDQYFLVYKGLITRYTPAEDIALVAAIDRIAALEARLKEAEQVVKPFAHPDLCAVLGGNKHGEDSIIFQRNEAVLRLRDTCRAAEWLKGGQG